jgi:hypothetical protein
VELAERGFRGAGPDGTIREFWEVITNDVSAETSFQSRYDKSSFVQARNAFFEGKGIGRAFIAAFLPSAAIRNNEHAARSSGDSPIGESTIVDFSADSPGR